MGLTPHEIKVVIDNLDISQEEKDNIMGIVQPMLDFSIYLENKLNISEDAVAMILQGRMDSLKSTLPELYEEAYKHLETLEDKVEAVDIVTERLYELTGDLFVELANEHGYKETEGLRKAVISVHKLR